MTKLNFIRTGIVMSILCIYTFNSVGQSSLTFTQAMDSVLAPLDKNRIPTGILYERVKPIANIDLFNLPSSDPFISDYSYFNQAYFELYNAAYNKTGWLNPQHLRAWAEGEALQGRYNIGVLDYQFNMIDSNALNNGQLSLSNGQFYDVPGTTNPYWTKRLQVAAILGDEIPSGQVSIIFNTGFIKTNQSVIISSIQLNFGTTGVYTLSSANPLVQVNFTGSGVKQFTATVQYTNGTSFSHSSEVQIGGNTQPYSSRIEGGAAELPDASFWISSKYPYKGFSESQPYYAKAKISIWWKKDVNNNPVPGIKKPVIILDGFDPFGGRLDTSIYNLFIYDSLSNTQTYKLNFARELRSQGFDIIVMDLPAYTKNFPGTINDPSSSLPYPKALYDDVAPDTLKGVVFGGGDYQQRSAYSLEALIDYCNQQLQNNASNEKLVLVGPSMGGQITRYALRDMELRGQNHNCRLWVSFDSNHEGSYAPVGLQYSLNELASGDHEAAFFKGGFLDCPEAKQSLLHHYLTNSETVQGVPGFFDQYYNEINNPSFGFPQAVDLRKIAMISGSDLGVPQTFGVACQQATSLEAKFRPRGFIAIILSYVFPLGPIPGTLGHIFSPLKTHKTYLAPSAGQCTAFGLSSTFSSTTKKIIAPSWSNTSLDMVQGGHFPAFSLYKNEIDGKRPKKWYKDFVKLTVNDYVGSQVQQLTYSTLAIGLGSMPNPNRKWDENFRKDIIGQSMDVTCPETKESPFDMYWGPDINTRHDSLLLGHVVRLRKEIIDKLPWQKTQIPRQAAIQGTKSILCAGESGTYTLTQTLPLMNYVWSTTDPNLQIITGQGTTQVTVSHIGNSEFNNDVRLSCTASSPCYIINAPDFIIHLGRPTVFGTYFYIDQEQPLRIYFDNNTEYNPVCNLQVTKTNMQVYGASSSLWKKVWSQPNYPAPLTQIGYNANFYLSAIGQNALLNFKASNKCGNTSYNFLFKSVSCGGSGGGGCLQYVVSPNPAKDILTITSPGIIAPCGLTGKNLTNEGEKMLSPNINNIRLLDMNGNIQRLYNLNGKSSQATINVADLKSGAYLLEITNITGYSERRMIIIGK
jgi:hypothetical protein